MEFTFNDKKRIIREPVVILKENVPNPVITRQFFHLGMITRIQNTGKCNSCGEK